MALWRHRSSTRLFRHGAGGSGVTSGRRLPAAERGRHVHIAGLQHLQPAELGGCGELGRQRSAGRARKSGHGPAGPLLRCGSVWGGKAARRGECGKAAPGLGPTLGTRHLPWGPATCAWAAGRALPRFPGAPYGAKERAAPPLLPQRRGSGPVAAGSPSRRCGSSAGSLVCLWPRPFESKPLPSGLSADNRCWGVTGVNLLQSRHWQVQISRMRFLFGYSKFYSKLQ